MLIRMLATACLLSLVSFPTGAFEAADLPVRAPEGAEPLSGDQIRQLLGSGQRFNFIGVSAPITGTGYWDLGTKTAYGEYEIDHRIKGNWTIRWYIDGNKNCLGYSLKGSVCTHIYGHGDGGFLEVNMDGQVHTVYSPVVPEQLLVPLGVEEVRTLLAQFLVWNQEDGVEVGNVRFKGDSIVADVVAADGSVSRTFAVDAKTGMIAIPDAQ
jgi:hypothetical protein